MSPARSTCLALVSCVLMLACDTAPSQARRVRAEIEPFLDDHARFDRWARRLEIGEAGFRSREALREAAFAPLRDRGRIVAAWLVREGPDATELRYPDGAPPLPDGGWVRVLLPEHELEEVSARQATLTIGGEEREVTLIRRSRPAPGDAVLHVTLAF